MSTLMLRDTWSLMVVVSDARRDVMSPVLLVSKKPTCGSRDLKSPTQAINRGGYLNENPPRAVPTKRHSLRFLFCFLCFVFALT
jgi:hypothetical protein